MLAEVLVTRSRFSVSGSIGNLGLRARGLSADFARDVPDGHWQLPLVIRI